MAVPKETLWEIEPHTLAKHEILRRYLGAWFPILTTYNQRILYVDGFCGPGRYKGGEFGSPILAVREALKHSTRLNGNKVLFYFMDERSDRIEHLRSELQNMNAPNNFVLNSQPGEFEVELRKLLDEVDSKQLQLVPTFAFIDPFGFRGLPFDLVRRLLKNPKIEIFVNVMVDSINRFLEHPDSQIRQHIADLFGTPKALEIAQTSTNRIVDLRRLYQQQLLTCAKFVRYFEMRDQNNKPIYYLFFAGNHPLGHLRMKEAFWKVDATSGFCFSDATNPNQLLLLEMDESPKLASELERDFAKQRVNVGVIEQHVNDKTAFLGSHMRSALAILESEKRIEVEEYKTDGNKRRGKSFPKEVVINFK